MSRLLKSFLFKISKDVTFRITLIIGGGMALLLTLVLAGAQYGLMALDEGLGDDFPISFISGQGMLLLSLNPAQNFAIAVPITLVIFICLEFTQGAIRNKIIAGHSKFKIFASLYLSGLLYGFALIISYAAVCTLLGTIFGGFDLSKIAFTLSGAAVITPEYLLKAALIAVLTYTSIVAFAVFVAALFRSIGPCIPVVFIVLMLLSTAPTLINAVGALTDGRFQWLVNSLRIIDPLYALCVMETAVDSETAVGTAVMSNFTFFSAIGSNIVYAVLFFGFGGLIFSKRDVK